MKILVLNRIPYSKIQYERGISHDLHDVTYIGLPAILKTIPSNLSCRKIARPGFQKTSIEVIELIKDDCFYDCIISLSEYELIDAAEIREEFNIPGPKVKDVLKVRDKIVMKQALFATDIQLPRFSSCVDFMKKPEEARWSGKTVLKPRDGASSENVVIFESVEKARSFVSQGGPGIKNFSNERFELEEFINGPILHFDGLVTGGEVIALVASEYVGTCLGYANGSPLGSVQIELTNDLKNWALRCIKAIGIRAGSFHLEAIRSSTGLVFLEVANRVGGADVVDTFELATGIHLPSEELKIILANIPSNAHNTYSGVFNVIETLPQYYSWFVFPGHHLPDGECNIYGLEFLKKHPMLVRLNSLSNKQPLPRNITYQSFEVPVSGILTATSPDMLRKEVQSVFSKINVTHSQTRSNQLCFKSSVS